MTGYDVSRAAAGEIKASTSATFCTTAHYAQRAEMIPSHATSLTWELMGPPALEEGVIELVVGRPTSFAALQASAFAGSVSRPPRVMASGRVAELQRLKFERKPTSQGPTPAHWGSRA